MLEILKWWGTQSTDTQFGTGFLVFAALMAIMVVGVSFSRSIGEIGRGLAGRH